MKNKVLIVLLLLLMVFGVSGVKAQETEKDGEATNSGIIFNKTNNTQKIKDLKILYRDQIEAYRNSEKEFVIAKSHYFNVQTLTALEEAVGATELAMDHRSKVLITYLELIGATLEDTAGVELALKEES